jgi:16S rRNA (guanine527-N7)-methyltransferase
VGRSAPEFALTLMAVSAKQLASVLERGADELGVVLSTAQVMNLVDFLELLERWNRAYNLTAVREPLQMVSRHLLDSLAITPLIRGKTLLDVGSGAGLPGLVLAIAMPGLDVTLLDPALKRTRFLAHAVNHLGVRNARVERARIEEFTSHTRFDTVTSRATIALDVLVDATIARLSDDGRLVAMLGKAPQIDAVVLPPPFRMQVERLQVPGIDAARHAAVISRGCAPLRR